MAIAKRGTRRLVVDGIVYRWVVSPNDGYMVLVVELAEVPAQRLEAVFPYSDVGISRKADGTATIRQGRVIGPGIVRQTIMAAIARGWRPTDCKPAAFRLDDAEQLVAWE